MSPAQQRGIALWAALLSAVVCMSFLPVSRLVSVLILLAILGLIMAFWYVAGRRLEPNVTLCHLNDLPETTYRQPVVLVCGDLALAWPHPSPVANQVDWIMNLPPGWRLRYGQGLIVQAKALWPNDPATRVLVQRWEQYQVARTLPASQLRGWHDGMKQLHALSAKLDALDHQKGKYLTVSELKTMIWQITNSFASAVPVEEQLRQLVTVPEDVTAPGANIVQAAQHLDSLIHMLEQLSAQKVNVVESGPVGETE